MIDNSAIDKVDESQAKAVGWSEWLSAAVGVKDYCCFIGNNLNESKNRFVASGSRPFVLAFTDN
jgi:hypothetical protein